MDDKNIDITFATMGDVMSYQAYNPTGGFVESSGIFDDDGITGTMTVKASDGKDYTYIPFGADNLLPYQLIKSIGESSVMAQNKLFNVLTCYGMGFQYNDIKTKLPSDDKDVNLFKMHNSLSRFFLEQITDMKYFFFCVSAIILNKKGDRIVAVRHKEACYCRFTQSKNGRSEYVLYANWRNALEPENIEAIPLLDELDPLGDLQERMGLKGQSGQVKSRQGGNGPRTKARVFAIVTRFPTAGCQYYPVPYYSAIFRDKWYDISRLIAIGKMSKLKNHAAIPYLVEIHNDYWRGIFKEEHITNQEDQKKRKLQEKEKIKSFISGIENSGKLWVAGYYTTPDGKEVNMVKITRIDTSKDGGDYSDDIAESNNMQCYADNIHPNLVGATPGKSQTNNSGSDKRELFTLKQSIEKAFHDLMETVHWVVIYFNHWEDKVYPDVPLIMLTTLDENKDAKKVSNNPKSQTDD